MRAIIGMAGGLLVVTTVACGGSSPSSPSGGGGGTTAVTATLSSIQSQVFSQRCYGCHGTNRREQNLDLQNNGHGNIVNRQSNQTSLMLVSPGNPDQSYLLHKVEGRSGIVGSRMPQGQAALSAEEITAIRTWIQNGALNN